MDMMEIRRHVFASQPRLQTVRAGNTADCSVIAHFHSDMDKPVAALTVELPYKAEGYTGLKLTACGINLLQCYNFGNGTSGGITWSGYRNNDGEITYITAAGIASGDNRFRNLNYEADKFKYPPDGAYATYAYSPNAIIAFVSSGSPVSPPDRNGIAIGNENGNNWKVYDLVHYDSRSAEWVRAQIVPYYCSGISFNATIYPMVCMAQDEGCAYAPYKGRTYTITFASTVYSGTVNLLTGEISGQAGQFTPISGLSTQIGVNNIWSDSGNVEVKYWSH